MRMRSRSFSGALAPASGQRRKSRKGLSWLAGVEPGAQLRVLVLDQLGVVLQADHVLGEDAEDRRRDARGGVALQRVDVVLGHQFARAAVLEVQRRAPLAQFAGLHRVVAVAALLVLGKGRVRLEQDAGLDADVVDALGHQLARRIVGQRLAVLVQVGGRDHLGGRLRHQLEGPQQVVVAVGRLVDLVGVGRVVAPVRGRRVEVARRALDHRTDRRVGGRQVAGQGVVVAAGQSPAATSARAANQRQQGSAGYQATKTSRPCTASCTRAPTGSVTLVGTWPKGSPVRIGVAHTERRCCTAARSE